MSRKYSFPLTAAPWVLTAALGSCQAGPLPPGDQPAMSEQTRASQRQGALARECACNLTEKEPCEPPVEDHCETGLPADDIYINHCKVVYGRDGKPTVCQTETIRWDVSCSGSYPNCGTYHVPEQTSCHWDERHGCPIGHMGAYDERCTAVPKSAGHGGYFFVDDCSGGTDQTGQCPNPQGCYQRWQNPVKGQGCVDGAPPSVVGTPTPPGFVQGKCEPQTSPET
jgi:hypothetical protein